MVSVKNLNVAGNLAIPSSPVGFGFKVIGGNAVGLFVSEVNLGHREVSHGVQILQINGKDARGMTHYEAGHLATEGLQRQGPPDSCCPLKSVYKYKLNL